MVERVLVEQLGLVEQEDRVWLFAAEVLDVVWTLRLLDRFLVQSGVDSVEHVSPAIIDAFLASRPRKTARSFNELLGIVRHLFDWLVSRDVIEKSPVVPRKRRTGAGRRPFLFDIEQARGLIQAAGRMQDYRSTRLLGPTYRMVFALLYGPGLRVGEVRRLQVRLGSVWIPKLNVAG